jgi:hypothetical protein
LSGWLSVLSAASFVEKSFGRPGCQNGYLWLWLKAILSFVAENVYVVRIKIGEVGNTYCFLVGIECGLHQLTKHETAQQFAQSAFLAKHIPGRQITIYNPELYEGASLPSLPKVNQGCDCWIMEI